MHKLYLDNLILSTSPEESDCIVSANFCAKPGDQAWTLFDLTYPLDDAIVEIVLREDLHDSHGGRVGLGSVQE